MPRHLINAQDIPESFGGGRYLAKKALGRGGASDVFLVEDQELGVPRVIKALQSRYRGNAYLRARFLSEGMALQSIVHPHVVRLFNVFEDQAVGLCMVLEYCPGGTARGLAKRRNGIHLDDLFQISHDALVGLGEVHRCGIVHRDVKPSNLLIDFYGKIKIADFGIARLLDPEESLSLTRVGTAMGSPSFMAPEQRVSAKEADARSDVFGMGTSIFAMSTAQPPPDLSVATMMPDHPVWDLIPPSLRPLVQKACQRTPADRYQSAEEMLEALIALG